MLMIIAGLGMMALIAMLIMGGKSGVSKKRQAMVAAKPGEKSSGGIFSFMKSGDENSLRRKQVEASLGDIEAKTKNREKARKSLKSKLIQANWSTKPRTFTLISAAIGLVCGAIAFFFGLAFWQVVGVAVIVGFGLPRWFLNMVIKRRQAKFTSHFADAMEIIVRGVRTGLPLGDCLKIIAHESPEPVREEFARVVEAEAVGVPIETCLDRMYDRMPLSEVKFFSTVLNIQRSTGGNLGEALANLAHVLRGRKLLREKIKALAAEAKASAVIIGALPPGVMILVTVVSPDYMVELYTTSTGHRNLMIGAGMMLAGIAVMRKMINFKF
ncbi:type II secretion system F family protein [Robiginitomaculum antarcticum]|uniref:type II secretion system F family protein n=1 Tax=Robiginitomaculum antarcticum TaxID=437507 RepID=UPI00146144CD|nr:type II secretion system F family protein [Robiginitomaculum antarcticum]